MRERSKYKVTLTYLVDYEVEVEARTPEEAENVAEQIPRRDLEQTGSEIFAVEAALIEGGEVD